MRVTILTLMTTLLGWTPALRAELPYPDYARYQGKAYASYARDCFTRLGPLPECASMLEAATQFNPDDADAQFLLGRYHLLHGDRSRALGCFAQVQRLAPERTEVLLWMGELYLQDGKPGPAREKFSLFSQKHATRWEGELGLASLAAQQGDKSQALSHLKLALSRGYQPSEALLQSSAWTRLKEDAEVKTMLALPATR